MRPKGAAICLENCRTKTVGYVGCWLSTQLDEIVELYGGGEEEKVGGQSKGQDQTGRDICGGFLRKESR